MQSLLSPAFAPCAVDNLRPFPCDSVGSVGNRALRSFIQAFLVPVEAVDQNALLGDSAECLGVTVGVYAVQALAVVSAGIR